MTLQYPVSNINDPLPPSLLTTPFAITPRPLTPDNGFVSIDATGGGETVELPPANGVSVLEITIQKSDATVNAITIIAAMGDTINGTAGPLIAQWQSVTLLNDGVSTWNVIETQP